MNARVKISEILKTFRSKAPNSRLLSRKKRARRSPSTNPFLHFSRAPWHGNSTPVTWNFSHVDRLIWRTSEVEKKRTARGKSVRRACKRNEDERMRDEEGEEFYRGEPVTVLAFIKTDARFLGGFFSFWKSLFVIYFRVKVPGLQVASGGRLCAILDTECLISLRASLPLLEIKTFLFFSRRKYRRASGHVSRRVLCHIPQKPEVGSDCESDFADLFFPQLALRSFACLTSCFSCVFWASPALWGSDLFVRMRLREAFSGINEVLNEVSMDAQLSWGSRCYFLRVLWYRGDLFWEIGCTCFGVKRYGRSSFFGGEGNRSNPREILLTRGALLREHHGQFY